MQRPRVLQSSAQFLHKDAVLLALEGGASCRKDDRQLGVDALLGVFEIRLRIALDQTLNGGIEPSANSVANDISDLVANLRTHSASDIAAYYIRAADGERFTLIEDAESGEYLGCLRSLDARLSELQSD